MLRGEVGTRALRNPEGRGRGRKVEGIYMENSVVPLRQYLRGVFARGGSVAVSWFLEGTWLSVGK
jgi:hypothetical protein